MIDTWKKYIEIAYTGDIYSGGATTDSILYEDLIDLINDNICTITTGNKESLSLGYNLILYLNKNSESITIWIEKYY